ncbi:unnamed protein product [Didymodactylos carnosus]|uniref:Uncharacterized protein n=1 Tax=Didymodactylos carnosus TaxID=1234261 RepID=A0A814WV65_9BILA|nr:unnamed protein product [Didymodactylos carnosus]CAF3970199.1 unnamed protein product [Didymodactylos carnosus]
MSLSDLGKSSNNDNDSNDDYDNGSARRYSVIVTSANEDVFIGDEYVNPDDTDDPDSDKQPLLNHSIKSNQHGSLCCKNIKTRYIIAILAFFGFFCGYTIRVNLSGNFAERYGAKYIFGGSVLITGLLTLLTPVAARTHVVFLIAIRVLIGICSGPLFPSAGALWGRWIPPLERSTIPPAATTGANIGIVISTPLHHRTPWKDIIKCVPLYGITIMHVCANFVFYTLLTSLPIYFATILNFDLHENGFLFALPYFCQSVITVCAGNIMERIRKKTKLTTTSIRKIPTIIGCVGLSISLVAIGYFECNRIGAVLCCILAVGFIGFLNVGSAVSYLDLAPNYAGTLVGITNTLGTIPGFVGPLIVGAITNHNQTLHAWKVIFDLTAGIGIFGCVAFCLLFRGEEQKWNHHPDTAEEKTVLQSDLLN